ncbi:MAG TPA: TIGR02281 family clan AA aspartic protease [Gammaproteobacteria bacterium]|nr:TIGR02281 family clan AA aspartic protease [Gammaproteobacteria bacterium]
MTRSSLCCALALLLGCAVAGADTTLHFIGQFGDKAVIRIDGRQRVLGVGETSAEGVKLLSVDSDRAVIAYRGRKRTLGFAPASAGTYRAARSAEVRISADRNGSFHTPGSINGQLVDFVVDTGATTVAMNERVAGRLGIDFRYTGTPVTVTTASGVVGAYSVRLDAVRVGEIELRNVQATVVEGGYPLQVLLGMSFLSRVEMQRKGKLITLRKTH